MASTSKGIRGPAILLLEDGTVFYGRGCGACGTSIGEVCFNTSIEGYFEVLSDPSYAGQIVTMCYPQIGNYGVASADSQMPAGDRARPALSGMIVHDMCPTPSSWRSNESLPAYLKRHGVVAIEDVDTRALVRHLRDHGSQQGIISTDTLDLDELARSLSEAPSLVGTNLVKKVSGLAPASWGTAELACGHAFALNEPPRPRHRVVVLDCGVKRSILDGLVRAGCELRIVSWDTPAAEVLAAEPDGVFLSNGPGDPEAVRVTYEQVAELIGRVPVFGICLGHQMISLAAGGRTEKLAFGHHGGNHPVMNLISRRVEITAQNHGFGLDFSSLGPIAPALSGGFSAHVEDGDLRAWVERGIAPVVDNERFGRIRLTHVNLNDGTPEGIQLLDRSAFSVQYHPEASPGPTDARYLFGAFSRLMDGDPDYLDIDISRDRVAGWRFGADPARFDRASAQADQHEATSSRTEVAHA
nr:glutamine-hydrolyzing carbamoyl-phosphate synthase small subunit [Coriobacterium glomerans]